MMKKILLLGPILPPIHGQSLAFTRFIEEIDDKKKIIININNDSKSMLGKVLITFKTLSIIFIKSLFTKYDLVYFTCSRSFLGSLKDLLLINLASLRGKKIINHLHGSDFYDLIENSPNWYKKILLYSYNKVDTSIVLLDSMKNEFNHFKNMNIEVIPNFYDSILDVKIEDKLDSKINLLYLSNIISSKGIFELINAFEYLSKKNENIYLNIAGGFISDNDMNMKEIEIKFRSLIKDNNRIKYFGKVFGEDKIKLLQKSDIFVLPTYYKSEAFPISIIEAMACGNVIVTTKYKYLPEVVTSKNGILVEPKSIDSLVVAIENLFKNKANLKEIQKSNKIEAFNKYSFEKYIKNLNRVVFLNDIS